MKSFAATASIHADPGKIWRIEFAAALKREAEC